MWPLTYTAWLDRRRPPDADLSDKDFLRRLDEDARKKKDAFDAHIYSLSLAVGVTAGLCFGDSFAIGLLGFALCSFLFHGWKAWT